MQLTNHTLSDHNTYQLRHALLIFENSRGNGLFTRAEITTNNGQTTIGQPVPITSSVTRQLLQQYSEREFTLTDPALLAHASDRCAWWIPPRPAAMHYATKDQALSSISGASVMHPALIMISRARNLYVFAVKGQERPDNDTPIYLAPYWNLHEDSSVCIGANPMPTTDNEGGRLAWQTLFFSTPFSHPNTLPRWQTLTYAQLWETSLKQQRFPEQYLLPADMTLQELLCQHSK